jgi:ubiquinone/menaquinone biosynthesis C-methylase UbiE
MDYYYERMQGYYERRAAEYDDAYLEEGLYAERGQDPAELWALERAISALSPTKVLDVGCRTGFLTRHLKGEVVGLDQSEAMLKIARERVPGATFVRDYALELPFPDGSFERIFTSNLSGLIPWPERERFGREARRVAAELVVLETAQTSSGTAEAWEERPLLDGSRHRIYGRYFTAEGLAEELGAGKVLFAGQWFVMVAVSKTPNFGEVPFHALR